MGEPGEFAWYEPTSGHGRVIDPGPYPASWDPGTSPSQIRLKEYLAGTEASMAPLTAGLAAPIALRLDVGLKSGQDPLRAADLDNYAYPLVRWLTGKDKPLAGRCVSVYCRKQVAEASYVDIGVAQPADPPAGGLRVVTTTAPGDSTAYKQQIHDQVADLDTLPAGPVQLDLSFRVGARRNWINLWKPTIDALGPILGEGHGSWHPDDGRITRLSLHLVIDPLLSNAVQIAICAGQTSG